MVEGFLVVDKPSGMTSHDVVDHIRHLSGIRKIGHTGTLDPMATGVLVIAIGRATRLIRFLDDLTKTYRTEVVFGIATDTLDADGKVISSQPMQFERPALESVLGRFIGVIEQTPPMVSAVKVKGRRLYELARNGLEVEREARTVTIDALELEEFIAGDNPRATFRVVCSTGTYVRTLADDLGRALGGRAHLASLRRLAIGRFDQPVALSELDEDYSSHLLRPVMALSHLPVLEADVESVRYGRQLPADATGLFRIIDETGELVAVYRGNGGAAVPEVVLR